MLSTQERDIFCAAIGNLGAGVDTLGLVQQAVFYFLLKEDPTHPQRLRNEIDDASTAGMLSQIVSHAEAQKLPYLQAMVRLVRSIHCNSR